MNRGDWIIEKSTGDCYIVFDVSETDVCILQWFDYAQEPRKRQLGIWQDKSRFILETEK